MAKARTYPPADRTTQWWESAFPRGTFTAIEKILLHTTETTGWPGYKGGASAPTLTYHPRQRKWRQHNFLNTSARALVDPTTTPVRENRDNVIQIEIIAYADEALAATVGGLPVSQLTDDHLGDLADFIKFVRAEWGGPPLVSAQFPYPRSRDSSLRMSSAKYDAFQGILGHLHASGNEHWDPGAFNAPRLMQLLNPLEDDLNYTDIIPGTNPPVTVGAALARALYSYAAITEGGSTETDIDALQAEDVSTDNRLDKVEAGLSAVPELIDKKLADAAVKVDVAVTYPQEPSASTVGDSKTTTP